MSKYKLLKIQGELVDTVLREEKVTLENGDVVSRFNTSIPYDPNNIDYQEYLEWKDAGNTPEEAD